MRLLFVGTAEFGVPSLRECAAHHQVLGVVTQPDRLGDRGRPAPRPVRAAADELDLPVRAPERIRDADVVAALLELQPDAVVVAAYGQLLPPALLDTPRFGAVNVHASLLPRWRGAAPVAHAILAGDTRTGVSIMRMDPGLDTGPVYASAVLPVRDDATTPLITAQLAGLGAELLIDVLLALQGGTARASPQPDEGVTQAPHLRRDQGTLEWSTTTAVAVDRHVRALQPWPGVTLPLGGVRMRVLEGALCDVSSPGSPASPGAVLRTEGESVVVQARDGTYRLDRVLPPGSRPMTPAAWFRGHPSA